jgi:hypothetical protein
VLDLVLEEGVEERGALGLVRARHDEVSWGVDFVFQEGMLSASGAGVPLDLRLEYHPSVVGFAEAVDEAHGFVERLRVRDFFDEELAVVRVEHVDDGSAEEVSRLEASEVSAYWGSIADQAVSIEHVQKVWDSV